MKLQTRQNVSQDRHSAGTGVAEAEVVSGLPDAEFRQIEKVHKDTGGGNQLVRVEAEENMAEE